MKTIEIEVADIRKIHGEGNVKAFADVKIADSVVIKGFSVVLGKRGVFVSMPRKLAKDGKWHDMLILGEYVKRDIEEKVLEAYDHETDGVSG